MSFYYDCVTLANTILFYPVIYWSAHGHCTADFILQAHVLQLFNMSMTYIGPLRTLNNIKIEVLS